MADWLEVPTHVLRFWESRFSQIKPVKRAGGRRYYRPSDMRIIGGVKVLLHDQGMTIRGVQKLFREEGLKHISTHAPKLYEDRDLIEGRVLDPAALEEASRPAPAARMTHAASLDPILDDRPQNEDDIDDGETTPGAFFRHTTEKATPRPARPKDTGPTHIPDAEVADEAQSDPKPAIPPTPDVPDTDPADNDAAYSTGPGIAARLALLSKAELEANRDTLEGAATRLKALLDRAS